jgi:cytoskeletal protein CcmA (bactofilin family)
MADPISTSPLGNDPINSNESDYVAQLGRISGKLLSSNLLRNGVDLSFRNNSIDNDILTLKVLDRRIGIKTDTPIFDLDVNNFIISKRLILNVAKIDNILFQSTARISTVTGEINIQPGGPNPTALFDRLQAGNIILNENFIENSSTDQNLIFSPNGSGTVELQSSTNISGELYVTGNINLDGDLSTAENIIIGDNDSEDILTLLTKFNTNLRPSVDKIYDIGTNSLRWKDIYSDRLNTANSIRSGNVSIASPATISSTTGSLNFNLSGSNKQMIFNTGLSTPDFSIINNKIKTGTNKNLRLEPSGSGKTLINSNTLLSSNLSNTGDFNFLANLTIDRNLTVGNNKNQDILTIVPKFQNNLLPKISNTYDIGTNSLRWKDVYSNKSVLSNSIRSGNVSIASPATISSTTGSLNFNLSGSNKQMIFNTGLSTPDFSIINNKIKTGTNKNLRLEASGSGKVLFNNITRFSKNVSINGYIQMSGNLSTTSNIIVGDQITDTVTINVNLDQDIIPKTTLSFDLGKSDKRWRNAYIPDWTKITNIKPKSITVNGSMLLGGLNNIRALNSNEDLIINPQSGITTIERVKIENNDITNLDSTPISLAATGIGYYVISGNNGFVIPFGTTAERPLPSGSPQAMTRWNTELEQLECFDSTTETWRRAIGSTDVNIGEMEDYSYFYTLILG